MTSLADWMKPYFARPLRGIEGLIYWDEGHGAVRITRPSPNPVHPWELRVRISRKVADELLADIAAGNQQGQDLIGLHLAEKLDRHREVLRARSGVDVEIGIT